VTASFIKSNSLSAATCAEAAGASFRASFSVRDYDLVTTLTSGQAFRWHLRDGWWEGVIGSRWVRLRAGAVAETDAVTGGVVGQASRLPLGRSAPEFVAGETPARAAGTAAPLPTGPGSSQCAPKMALALPNEISFLGRGGPPFPSGGRGVGREGDCNDSFPEPPAVILAETAEPVSDWRWLSSYLQVEQDLAQVLASFPDDEPMRAAVAACRGLRLLRQDPWECLASFILSSTKRIVQIQQIVEQLGEQFGEQVIVPPNHEPVYSFTSAVRIGAVGESKLRACKMGFRAPNLRAAAQMVARGEVDLDRLPALPVSEARATLMRLPGVGRKIADCVLLFACGFQDAFPVDVWVMKALRGLYFPRRRVSLKRLQEFAATHFGPWRGYAQQYLFHYARVHVKLKE